MLKQLKKICLDRWFTFARAETGVAAIEFVMVAPPIFLMLGMILETGVMFFAQYSLQAAVESAARTVRTGAVQTNNVSSANFKNEICNYVGTLMNCAGAVTVYVRSDPDFATMVKNLPPLINIGPSTGTTTVSAPPCYNPGNPSQPAVIIATYDWYFTSWGMSSVWGNVAGNKANRLTALTVFKNQAYPGSTSTSCP